MKDFIKASNNIFSAAPSNISSQEKVTQVFRSR